MRIAVSCSTFTSAFKACLDPKIESRCTPHSQPEESFLLLRKISYNMKHFSCFTLGVKSGSRASQSYWVTEPSTCAWRSNPVSQAETFWKTACCKSKPEWDFTLQYLAPYTGAALAEYFMYREWHTCALSRLDRFIGFSSQRSALHVGGWTVMNAYCYTSHLSQLSRVCISCTEVTLFCRIYLALNALCRQKFTAWNAEEFQDAACAKMIPSINQQDHSHGTAWPHIFKKN